MIVKKAVQAQSSNHHQNSQYWAAGVNHIQAGFEDKALAVFQPDILIPSQYLATYQRRFNLDPERGLMLAVLQDAIVCYQEHLTATCKRKRLLFEEAEEWLFNSDSSYLFSFENICEALGFEAQYLRHGLVRWKAAELMKRGDKHVSKRLAS